MVPHDFKSDLPLEKEQKGLQYVIQGYFIYHFSGPPIMKNSNSWISHQVWSLLHFILRQRMALIHSQLKLEQKKQEVRVTKILNLEGLTNAKFGAEMPADNWQVASDLQSSS